MPIADNVLCTDTIPVQETVTLCSVHSKIEEYRREREKMEITACVKAVVMAASQHNNNRSNSNMGYLLHQLEVKIELVLF